MLDFVRPKVIPFLLGVLCLNVVILDYVVFFKSSKSIIQNISVGNSSKPSTNSSESAQTVQSENQGQVASVPNACPVACLDTIKTATASLKLTQQIINNTTTQSAAGGAQEFFVPFGSASGASQGTFTTLGGLQAYVNMSQYSGVQTVVFEVSVYVPTGNEIVWVQLYNATDGYVIPNSTVTMSGGTPQLLISPNITLPAGNKLYQVQINTQLSSPLTIDQARLHITTN